MNATRYLRLIALLLFAGTAWLHAADAPVTTPPPATEKLRESLLLPGVTLSEGVSEITGAAISPLLGVSVMGAWTYYRTEEHLRHRLPWYCHPWAWGTGLSLLTLCFLKDFLGAAAPALVKKPLDFAELFENKLSALVASTAFVPLVALAVAQADKITPQAAQGLAASHLAAAPVGGLIDFSVHTPWISIPVAMLAFVVVWLSSHAIHVLIALSPFGIVDAGLKLAKLALISLVTVSTMIHPYIGALISLVIILVALLLAGWAFRLSLFGTLMGSDFLLNKRAAPSDLDEGVRGFLARRAEGVPVRTLVRLKMDTAGSPVLCYRPWLLLPERQIPMSQDHWVLCKGLLHPTLASRPEGEGSLAHSMILLPRYRSLEEAVAQRFGCQEVTDGTLLRGLKAVRQWLVDVLSTGRTLVQQH